MNYVWAFIIGGIICVLSQILMDTTKMLPGRVMVTLVCVGAVLGAIGLYEPLLEFAGGGASVPLTGFGYCGRGFGKQLTAMVLSGYSVVDSRWQQLEPLPH